MEWKDIEAISDLNKYVKELEEKLQSYIKMRDELIDMNKKKDERLSIAVEALKNVEHLLPNKDSYGCFIIKEALAKIEGEG
jgi:predicted nuclease with TOPRIM domain